MAKIMLSSLPKFLILFLFLFSFPVYSDSCPPPPVPSDCVPNECWNYEGTWTMCPGTSFANTCHNQQIAYDSAVLECNKTVNNCSDGTPAPNNDVSQCPKIINCSDGTVPPNNDLTQCPNNNDPIKDTNCGGDASKFWCDSAGVCLNTTELCLPNSCPAINGIVPLRGADGKCPVAAITCNVNGVTVAPNLDGSCPDAPPPPQPDCPKIDGTVPARLSNGQCPTQTCTVNGENSTARFKWFLS